VGQVGVPWPGTSHVAAAMHVEQVGGESNGDSVRASQLAMADGQAHSADRDLQERESRERERKTFQRGRGGTIKGKGK
jgi:hypothetical protein